MSSRRLSGFSGFRAFVLLCLAAVTAFQASAQAPAKPLKTVTIAVGTQVLNVTYPWLTLPIVLGYWRDEGYDVKVITVGGSAVRSTSRS
jgi:NitT/TauT family transport system substrate-binding protein